MDTPPPPAQKKGFGPLAWLGIGCAGLIGLGVLAMILASVFFGDDLKNLAAEMEKNPARATASVMVKVSGGQFEFVAEDDVNKRYTVREKKTGKLTTVYLDASTNKPATVEGDFSAIPVTSAPPSGVTPPGTPAPPQ